MRRSPLLLAALLAFSWLPCSALAAEPEKEADGVIVPFPNYLLKVQVCSPDILRVAAAPDRGFFKRQSLIVLKDSTPPVKWTLSGDASEAVVRTEHLQARIDRQTGSIRFSDASGKEILAEKSNGRSLTSAELLGQNVLQVRQQWESPANEALYGLGQTQSGQINLKGRDLDLWQRNTEVFVPFFVSSRGYGILWDNTSHTRWGDLRNIEAIPSARLFTAEGQSGGLTGTYFSDSHFGTAVGTRVDAAIQLRLVRGSGRTNTSIHPNLPPGNASVRWDGFIEAPAAGRYTFQSYSDGGVHLWIDDHEMMNHWRQSWLPGDEVAQVNLEPGKHRIRLEWVKDQGSHQFEFFWKTPSSETATSLWSEASEGLDYYFVYGPEMDRVIAGYRALTGDAPMMPKWTFGLWQSRQRYETAQQLTDVVAGFRERKIPFDAIVQDWMYWPRDAWGSHELDKTRFPDPDAWVRQLHEQLHAHIMISVWGKFYPGTANFDALNKAGYLFQPNLQEGIKDWLGFPYTFYDAYIPEARSLFWSQVNDALFRRGFDAWWLDASEPDLLPTPNLDGQRTHLQPAAGGRGIQLLNAYALVQSQAVYEGQRAAAPDQRVFILTRSGFAGQQRYAAATWSGDITSTWTAMKKQIAAGLSFSISGVPYWTMDIGGFSVPARFSAKDPKPEDVEEWREMNTRWFQFGAFVPLLRVHGELPYREMWMFGGENDPAYRSMLAADRLRYRLLPYIYSLVGQVTHAQGTLMRPLVMDFRNDLAVREVTDQFLFGNAFLVSPVTSYKARERSVYLPADTTWYDFWTGAALDGRQTVTAPAPYEHIPLHVRAGSIVPLGPELQYVDEKPTDPITLLIYTGANGGFTLYEDDGLTFAYEKGASSRIPLEWDDAASTLKIGARNGEFTGMLKERTFNLIVINRTKPVPFSFDLTPTKTVHYDGKTVSVTFE